MTTAGGRGPRPDRHARALARPAHPAFIGAGAIAPVGFGYLGDVTGPGWATVATAVAALATVPLAVLLAPRLRVARGGACVH